jgi:hypothetical protein
MSVTHARRCMKILASFVALASVPTLAAEPRPFIDSSAFVLFTPGSRGAEMNGSMDDVRRATSLRVGNDGLLYVRQGGSVYVIRDPATLRKAKSLFGPEEGLGLQQTQLGLRQTALGQQQSQLGAEQAALSNRQASSSSHDAEDLARQQEELSRRQEALARQQEALGRQQEALGREQDRIARIADAKVQAIIADAVREGLAEHIN